MQLVALHADCNSMIVDFCEGTIAVQFVSLVNLHSTQCLLTFKKDNKQMQCKLVSSQLAKVNV